MVWKQVLQKKNLHVVNILHNANKILTTCWMSNNKSVYPLKQPTRFSDYEKMLPKYTTTSCFECSYANNVSN